MTATDREDVMDGINRFDAPATSALRDVSLNDRYDLDKSELLLSGVQALIRAPLMQSARDRIEGFRTAGYVTGYRGSPLGGVDLAAAKARQALEAADVRFEPALNEDLGATAVWGSQQAGLRGRGAYDGVFALWYGKGPGLDRSGDVFRHGNLAGAAAKGGALIAMGDDHTCESSTSCHQTDVTLMDAHIPVLHPAGPQEILDYSLLGWGLSRFTGCWVGLKCVKDTVEATTVVDGALWRVAVAHPDVPAPQEGLNIVFNESPQAQEARLVDWRLPAIAPFARANKFDQRRLGAAGARLGVVSSGKSWLDVLDALAMLGVDAETAERLGVSAYKVGLAWPIEQEGLRAFADGLETLLVVEEKRAFIETQIKDALYAIPDRPDVLGKRDAEGRTLFSQKMDLSPLEIARAIGAQIVALYPGDVLETAPIRAALDRIEAQLHAEAAPEIASRPPYFCAGCPHNSSTVLPDGAEARAGIGCHYMVQWMDRDTIGFTQMGGEGAQWIGEHHFSTQNHIFQNLGDGTYNHSGLMAIRAALASSANITFKILFNDAVAMTGGQSNEGGLSPDRIAAELKAAGVGRIDVVVDPKEDVDRAAMPATVRVWERDDLDQAQRELQATPGVSALIYVQTCAAEKRRRRKRGTFPDLPKRVMINDLVCEGCGDCGVQSNCVAILPKETEFGRKRQIDQSNCNKDLSCIRGFCPSFVTVEGVAPKRAAAGFTPPDMPEPTLPAIDGTYNVLVAGVGGTGVVTVGALIGMAAHLEGKSVGVMEMAGLAQKGGAVHIHCRIGAKPGDVSAVRVQPGSADAVIGGDLVVSGGAKSLTAMAKGRTGAIVNDFEIVTGDFTRDIDFQLPSRRLKTAIETALGPDQTLFFNATRLAEKLLGDSIYANVIVLGAAWQQGRVPLSGASLRRAIELNGAGVQGNLAAFEIGRWAAVDPEAARDAATDPAPEPETLAALIARRAEFLTAYQDAAWAERYRDAVEMVRRAETAVRPGAEEVTRAAAVSLFKLMSYKDEYEVARLHAENTEAQIAKLFDGPGLQDGARPKLSFYLAPPLLASKGADGKPRKIAFGGWMLSVFKILRHGKRLRGGALDPFGWTAERRMERALIEQFEVDLRRLARSLTAANHEKAAAVAAAPQSIRGFGHVKEANAAATAARRAALWADFEASSARRPEARAASVAAIAAE